jgi:hypothetical protein
VIETDEHGRAVRWFHPRWVAQLGILRDAPEWTFLDHAQQVRAWRSLDAGELALAMDRRIVPEAELTLPWRR